MTASVRASGIPRVTTPPRADDTSATARRAAGALRASGLPAQWARHYRCLSGAQAGAEAEEHVARTLATLPAHYRLAFLCALRALPVATLLTRGRRAAGSGGVDRLATLPGFREVVRATTTLALYGALDGRTRQEAP
ncbi:hypothetical protein [Streptomyces sp. NPDC021212]|uniref:hypothetical protein n=1 Tax=Streptomyces sp. NPDC021212 TaxID=3365118 RepID=UPI00379C8476